jgi:hypothetical protein
MTEYQITDPGYAIAMARMYKQGVEAGKKLGRQEGLKLAANMVAAQLYHSDFPMDVETGVAMSEKILKKIKP